MSSHKSRLTKGSFQFFTSMSQNSISFRAWFAILSVSSEPNGFYTDIFISMIEYLQLLAQSFLANDSLYAALRPTHSFINMLFQISSTFHPGYLIVFKPDDRTYLFTVFACVLCYLLLKYSLAAYIAIAAYKRRFCSKPVLTLWRWVFKIQGRIVFFIMASLLSRLFVTTLLKTVTLESGLNLLIMVVSLFFYILEFVFSVLLLTQFRDPTPNKSFLTCRNQHTEAITVSQKYFSQVFKLVLLNYLDASTWLRSFSNFAFSLLRTIYYLTTFPHYRVEAALYHSSLMITVTCVYGSYLTHLTLLSVYDKYLNPYFSLVMSVILSVLLVTLCRKYVRKTWLEMTLRDTNSRKDLFIHRIIALRQLFKEKIKGAQNFEKYSFLHLTSLTKAKRFEAVLATQPDLPQAINSKEDLKKASLRMLKVAAAKFLPDDTINLYQAHYFANKFKLYGLAVKILQDVQKSTSSINAATAHVLLYYIQAHLIAENRYNVTKLDLYSYMKNVELVSQLKIEILKQADSQVNLYTSFVKIPQDLNKIFELGQKVSQQRQIVEKRIQHLFETIPGYYVEPLMICAHYYFVLNHAPHRYQHYIQINRQKNARYKNLFEKDEVCQENLYHRSSNLIVLSTNKKELGVVKYVSRGATELFGKNLANNHFCTALPDELKDSGYKLANAILEVVDQAVYDRLLRTITYNFSKKFYTECAQYYNMNPLLYQGLYIMFFLRVPSNSEQFLIVRENGDILGFTQQVGQKLGLFERQGSLPRNAEINVSLLSKKLERVNQAFNMISSPEKYPNSQDQGLDAEEAKRLYDSFSKVGEEVQLRYLGQKDKERYYSYHCKFVTKYYGGKCLRAIVFGSSTDIELNTETKVELSREQLEFGTKVPFDKENESEASIASEDLAPVPQINEANFEKDYILSSERNTSARPLRLKNFGSELRRPEKRDTDLFSTEQDNLSSRRLLSARNFTPRLTSQADGFHAHSNFGHYTNKNNQPDKIQLKPLSEYQSSQTGKRIDAFQRSKEYESALRSTYYPHYFRLFIVAFYIVFLGIVGINIYTTKYYEDNIQILEARKNAMRLVIARTDQLANLHGQTRRLWSYVQGTQNESNYPTSYRSAAVLQRMSAYLPQLALSNKNLMIATNDLDATGQERLFQKKVTITNMTKMPIMTVDSFLATNKILEVGDRALNRARINVASAVGELNFILRNEPNDLLIENEKIAYYFATKVYDQGDYIVEKNRIGLGTSLGLAAFIFGIFCFIVIKQYGQAKRNMLALTKIDMQEVTKVMEKVVTFQNMLQDEVNFEEIENKDVYDSSKVVNKEASKKVQSANFHKKYWRYPVKFMALLIIVIGLLLAKFFVIEDSVYDLSNIVTQIYFSDRIGPRLRLDSFMSLDILGDNTTTIRNIPVLQAYNNELYFLQNATHNLTDYLRNRDSTYDPIINGILFGDACAYVTPASGQQGSCSQLGQDFQKAGLVRFMSGYQTTLINFLNAYELSNKSNQSIANLGVQSFLSITSPMAVMVTLLGTISSRLNNIFLETITNGSDNNRTTSGILFVSLIVIGLSLHFFVINKVKESENDFKNVLKAFPAKLVLSNFMLKSYLTRIWKDKPYSSKLLNAE